MLIRGATELDEPAIIELLKKSLGESLIPISAKFWKWKHTENPFGTSYVLIAEENNQIIGVRAFMKWTWTWNGKLFSAIRAVDTSTHPSHQGKGIFKKLTLHQLEICKQQGVHFVFNTPNNESRPGYLKMGWTVQGKMPLKIKLLRPLTLALNKFINKEKYAGITKDPSPVQTWNNEVLHLLNEYQEKTGRISTLITSEFIYWRYANNPLFQYNYFTDYKSFLLISRIKYHPFAKELRLVEFIILNKNTNDKEICSKMQKEIHQFCKEHKIDLISLSGQQYNIYKTYFRWMGIIPVKPLGPVITLRELNMEDQFNNIINIENWGYSLGDLELF